MAPTCWALSYVRHHAFKRVTSYHISVIFDVANIILYSIICKYHIILYLMLSYVRNHAFIRMTSYHIFIMFDVTNMILYSITCKYHIILYHMLSYVRHHASIRVTCLTTHMCSMCGMCCNGVASISRIDKIIGLFCNRAL